MIGSATFTSLKSQFNLSKKPSQEYSRILNREEAKQCVKEHAGETKANEMQRILLFYNTGIHQTSDGTKINATRDELPGGSGKKDPNFFKKIGRETKRVVKQTEKVVKKGAKEIAENPDFILDAIDKVAEVTLVKKFVQKTGVGVSANAGSSGGGRTVHVDMHLPQGPAVGIGTSAGKPAVFVDGVPYSGNDSTMAEDLESRVKRPPRVEGGGAASDPDIELFLIANAHPELFSFVGTLEDAGGSYVEPMPPLPPTFKEKPTGGYRLKSMLQGDDPNPIINLFISAARGVETARDVAIVDPIMSLYHDPKGTIKGSAESIVIISIDKVNTLRYMIGDSLKKNGIDGSKVDFLFERGTDGTRGRNKARIEEFKYIINKLETGSVDQRTELMTELAAQTIFNRLKRDIGTRVKDKLVAVIFDRKGIQEEYDIGPILEEWGL